MGVTPDSHLEELCREYEILKEMYEVGDHRMQKRLESLAAKLRSQGVRIDADSPEEKTAGEWLDEHGY